MKFSQKILIPIDFSDVAQNAVRHANFLGEKHPAEVVLVYVNTPDTQREELDILKTFKDFESATLRDANFFYTFEVMHGNLLHELANANEAHQADLVIMGTKDRVTDIALATELMRKRAYQSTLERIEAI